jgi:hypothetical protein
MDAENADRIIAGVISRALERSCHIDRRVGIGGPQERMPD